MTTPVETLTALRELHRPYLTFPLDVIPWGPWEPVAEKASVDDGVTLWCDSCRADAPCAQWLLITASIGEGA